jgi:hypothetical protein
MTVGGFLSFVAVLGCGGGAAQSADAGDGGGDPAASFLIACQPGASGVLVPAAHANPPEFSGDTSTGMQDQHTLTVLRRDVFDHTTTYITAGPADHRHLVSLTLQQNTVSIKPCGIPGG